MTWWWRKDKNSTGRIVKKTQADNRLSSLQPFRVEIIELTLVFPVQLIKVLFHSSQKGPELCVPQEEGIPAAKGFSRQNDFKLAAECREQGWTASNGCRGLWWELCGLTPVCSRAGAVGHDTPLGLLHQPPRMRRMSKEKRSPVTSPDALCSQC